jgi:hypothetical protein
MLLSVRPRSIDAIFLDPPGALLMGQAMAARNHAPGPGNLPWFLLAYLGESPKLSV